MAAVGVKVGADVDVGAEVAVWVEIGTGEGGIGVGRGVQAPKNTRHNKVRTERLILLMILLRDYSVGKANKNESRVSNSFSLSLSAI